MTFRFGAASERRLKGVHPALADWAREAILAAPIDFMVLEGLRSLEQQKRNVANGVSWTLKSKHLTGHALDIVPLVDGKPTWSWAPYYPLAKHLKAVAKKAGLVVTWGGDWLRNKDGPHWEIDPRQYPMPT